MRPLNSIRQDLSALWQRPQTTNGFPVLWTALLIVTCQMIFTGWDAAPQASVAGHSSSSMTTLSSLPSASWISYALRGTVIISACLWSASIATPITAWATTGAYLWVVTSAPAATANTINDWQIPFWILLINALWFHRYGQGLRGTNPWNGTWPVQKTCPAWVSFLCVYSIATLASLSGIQQFLSLGGPLSGGLSLQVTLRASGDLNSQMVQYLLHNRGWAAFVYMSLVTVQCCAVLAIVYRPLCTAVGLGLIAVQVFDFLLFGTAQPASTLLTAIVFLPWQSVPPTLVPKLKQTALYVMGLDQ